VLKAKVKILEFMKSHGYTFEEHVDDNGRLFMQLQCGALVWADGVRVP